MKEDPNGLVPKRPFSFIRLCERRQGDALVADGNRTEIPRADLLARADNFYVERPSLFIHVNENLRCDFKRLRDRSGAKRDIQCIYRLIVGDSHVSMLPLSARPRNPVRGDDDNCGTFTLHDDVQIIRSEFLEKDFSSAPARHDAIRLCDGVENVCSR